MNLNRQKFTHSNLAPCRVLQYARTLQTSLNEEVNGRQRGHGRDAQLTQHKPDSASADWCEGDRGHNAHTRGPILSHKVVWGLHIP